ncbi:PIN domain-containing protein [Aureimonas jatrophae]|uniref:Ribonuclease VapC n=1 Tax=Aureimonas jatrophae TaxID=1166073 RepID=A0A1H0MZ38_9HYPH|nr:type II toxin-antitoxin system VapC family toxin [Aureimonas jatrophae]MBB3952962.1 PIN domain nuclease of toxin-antitoxin system [Aureimonas jatrophae]SDO85684.1 PIN domain nuclease, a component of toxin-antitoxin system (PIN domain) [Aureimonas jatrophae]
MSARIVFDTSAVIALLRDEAGAEKVAPFVGQAAMSAVNLQELVKGLLTRGLALAVIEEIVSDLRLEIHDHDRAAAFAAAALVEATKEHGSGLGDRSCMALAIQLGIPVLTADKAWGKVKVEGLRVETVR